MPCLGAGSNETCLGPQWRVPLRIPNSTQRHHASRQEGLPALREPELWEHLSRTLKRHCREPFSPASTQPQHPAVFPSPDGSECLQQIQCLSLNSLMPDSQTLLTLGSVSLPPSVSLLVLWLGSLMGNTIQAAAIYRGSLPEERRKSDLEAWARSLKRGSIQTRPKKEAALCVSIRQAHFYRGATRKNPSFHLGDRRFPSKPLLHKR